jgi:hypothetical protein
MLKFVRLAVLLVALLVMLGVASTATLLAYWGQTAPRFETCSAAGRPSTHQSATYGRSSDSGTYTFSLDNTLKGISLRAQVATRSFLPLGIGGPSGAATWTLTDPSGAVRWQEKVNARSFDKTRQFDSMPGQWVLRYTLANHSGGYDICLSPLR